MGGCRLAGRGSVGRRRDRCDDCVVDPALAMTTHHITINADFSHFNVVAGDPLDPSSGIDPTWENGLMTYDSGLSVDVVVCQHWGSLPIRVELLDERPGAPESEWDDVAEISLARCSSIGLAGWAEDPTLTLEVDEAVNYRARYSIAGTDLARTRTEPPYLERYRLQFWPEVASSATMLVQRSRTGRYWVVSKVVQRVWVEDVQTPWVATGVRPEIDDAERDRLIRTVLHRLPGLAREIRRGEISWVYQIGSRFHDTGRPGEHEREMTSLVQAIAASPEFDQE